MASANELGPGVEIDGTYRIVRKLGEGGMGAVYVAELIRLPKRVALKVLHVASDESAKARFRREAEIAAKVRHPRIVEVLDYNFLEDGSPYLVMELLEGHDLRHRLNAGPLPPEEALPILRDVASALERLHTEGIVHRDLKPENIFLANEGDEVRAKVLDFGISKVVGGATSLTAEQSMLGTPAYMAPEQVTGENATLDARTDQFALAAVAYEMLTGRPAFRGEHVMQLFHQILTAPAPALREDGARSAADEVLARALSKDRAARYLSVSAFVLALSEALGVAIARFSAVDSLGATIAAPAITPPAAAPAPTEAAPAPRRARALALGALLLAVAFALAYALSSHEPSHLVEAVAPNPATPAPAPDPDTPAPVPVPDPNTPAPDNPDPDPDPVPVPKTPAPDPDPDNPAPAPDPVPVPKTPAPAPAPDPAPDPAPTPDPDPDTPDPDPVPSSPKKTQSPTNEDALARLARAEAALAAGDAQSALRHARASLAKQPSQAARAVLTKAACELRDLGLAKAMSRGLRGKTLREARQYCARLGLKL